MPSYKGKAKRTSRLDDIVTDVNYRFDEMEARSLVDGAILREIRNRVQQLSIAADASADVEKLAHLANQLKINFGEIESLAEVSSSVTLPPGEYTTEAVLNNLNQRMSDLLSQPKRPRLPAKNPPRAREISRRNRKEAASLASSLALRRRRTSLPAVSRLTCKPTTDRDLFNKT